MIPVRSYLKTKKTATIVVGDRVRLRNGGPLGKPQGVVVDKVKQGGRNLVKFDNGVTLRPLFDRELTLTE